MVQTRNERLSARRRQSKLGTAQKMNLVTQIAELEGKSNVFSAIFGQNGADPATPAPSPISTSTRNGAESTNAVKERAIRRAKLLEEIQEIDQQDLQARKEQMRENEEQKFKNNYPLSSPANITTNQTHSGTHADFLSLTRSY